MLLYINHWIIIRLNDAFVRNQHFHVAAGQGGGHFTTLFTVGWSNLEECII